MTLSETTTRPNYSIGAAAKHTGVSVDTLHYYEKAGLLANVARSDAGRRVNSEEDCGWILFIRRLRATAMPVSEIARYASLVRTDTGTATQRRSIQETHRERVRHALAELTYALTVLYRKIEHY